jgi:dihydrofolate reductase
MKIALIAALDENRVIGNDGGIPWHIPEDLEHYKNTVDDRVVISGRVTFEVTPGGHQGRQHIVLSRDESWKSGLDEVHHAQNVEEAVDKAENLVSEDEYVYVIGGENVYRQFLPMADKMVLSHIEGEHTGDTYYPQFSSDEWEVSDISKYEKFVVKEYNGKNE